MKLTTIVKIAIVALPLVFTACGSRKNVINEPVTLTPEMQAKANFISTVKERAQTTQFLTSKVKVSLEVGSQKLSLTGNLKMKRDDVVRLQLMAFGIVEAGRIEMTKDYVLIMDRINKQYLKAPWTSVDFLRTSGINFDTLQSLFWNELFRPNRPTADKQVADAVADYAVRESGDDMIISLEEGKMDYSWLASRNTAQIKMVNILYKDRIKGNTQLNWGYDQFEKLNKGYFPRKSAVTLTTPEKKVKLDMTLNNINAETEWETRTEISSKYRQVTADEILRRLMSI